METGNEYSIHCWPLNYNQNKDRTERGKDGGKKARVKGKDRVGGGAGTEKKKKRKKNPRWYTQCWAHICTAMWCCLTTVFTSLSVSIVNCCTILALLDEICKGACLLTHTHAHSGVTSLWKRLCSLRPCLAFLPDSSTSIFSGFSSSKASNFSITPERLQINPQGEKKKKKINLVLLV